jgi:hypothetical protein
MPEFPAQTSKLYMQDNENVDGHAQKHRKHKHKKHKRHKGDVDHKKSRRLEKEAGSDTPESGEIFASDAGTTSPALAAQSKVELDKFNGPNQNTDSPLGDRNGHAETGVRGSSENTRSVSPCGFVLVLISFHSF